MSRCLSERALVRLQMKEGGADEHAHLLACGDCTRRFNRLGDDLRVIHEVLTAAPPAAVARHRLPNVFGAWVPAAALSVAVVAILVSLIWPRLPVAPQGAGHNGSVSAFATDVSTAVFAGAATAEPLEIASDAPYLRAAFEEGWPCTGEQFFAGECDDQVSALFTAAD